jgi:hypothetical protein
LKLYFRVPLTIWVAKISGELLPSSNEKVIKNSN